MKLNVACRNNIQKVIILVLFLLLVLVTLLYKGDVAVESRRAFNKGKLYAVENSSIRVQENYVLIDLDGNLYIHTLVE